MSISTSLVFWIWIAVFVALPLFVLSFVKNGKGKTFIMSLFLILYLALLVVFIIGDVGITRTNVTIGFDFTHGVGGKVVNWTFADLTLMDTLINIVMLIPLGIILGYFFRHLSVLKAVLTCWYLGFAFGFILELSQYILPIARSVQLSDAIFNMISLFIGGFIGRVCVGLSKKIYKQK